MTNARTTIDLADEAGTERVGRALAELLTDGGVVTLDGPLGAGKTRLVQAVATACGVARRDVVSPTFVLVHEYRTGSRPIFHIDAYRINDDDEFLQLGPEEFFRPPNLVLIEWASRIGRCLPEERLEIAIEVLDATARRMEITGCGAAYEEVARRLFQKYGATGKFTE
jgi:tRNA threonylcarbamoyladenosine biosynthesis protein TsaE